MNVSPSEDRDLNKNEPTPKLSRSLTVVGALAVGLGLVGFLVGISEPVVPTRSQPDVSVESEQPVSLAPSYNEMQTAKTGANAGWTSQFAKLQQDRPDLFDPVVRTREMKNEALIDRLRTRAFDGAPPVVPHPVEQQSYANCLVCHGEGMRLGDRIASKVSHPHFASCTQCHVESEATLPFDSQPIHIENQFVGRLRAGPGSRAMPGAPPTIPHTTHLRTDCMSCHGLVTRAGLRTTHPWLQNCVQCHVADAKLDAIPFQEGSGDVISTIDRNEDSSLQQNTVASQLEGSNK